MKLRISHKDNLTPFGAHYVIMADHQLVQGSKVTNDPAEEDKQYVAFNLQALTDYLTHHMGKFETGGGMINLDGYSVPTKVAARFYIDALCTILGNSGVSVNLPKIREELCSTCIGSQASAPEFLPDGPAIIDMSHPQPEAGAATLVGEEV